MLLRRVPHPVVGARLGEMVAAARARGGFLGNDPVEERRRRVDDAGVRHAAANGDDAGAGVEDRVPFRQQVDGIVGRAPHHLAVIDRHVAGDFRRRRPVGQARFLFDAGPEGFEFSGILAQPGAVAALSGQCACIHGVSSRAEAYCNRLQNATVKASAGPPSP